MKLDFEVACDQLNSTNHSLLLELSSSASSQHILTMFIRRCTYMDTLPLRILLFKVFCKVECTYRHKSSHVPLHTLSKFPTNFFFC